MKILGPIQEIKKQVSCRFNEISSENPQPLLTTIAENIQLFSNKYKVYTLFIISAFCFKVENILKTDHLQKSLLLHKDPRGPGVRGSSELDI
jgi:hypothetical protein